MNDINQKRPLTEVAVHEAENCSSTSLLYDRIRIYRDRKVYNTFGLSLTEFLNYPPDICEHILLLCLEQQEQDNKAQQDVLEDLNSK